MFAGLVSILLVWTVVSADNQHCKKRYDPPSDTTALICTGLMNDMDLYHDLVIAGDATELKVVDSTLMYFAHGTFRGTKLKGIFIENSSLMAFTNGEVAFDGLQDYLIMLVMRGCSYVNNLDWNQLIELRKLGIVSIKESDLVYIPDMSALAGNSRLGIVDLSNNEVSEIHPKAFSQLKQVTGLSLNKNQIPSLERSMFANPARIVIFDVSDNLLSTLPEDLFTNMPSLRTIMLGGNKLITVSEKTFEGVFTQLSVLALKNNPLSCDCRLRWLLQKQTRKPLVHAERSSPSAVKGQRVLDLQAKDLWC